MARQPFKISQSDYDLLTFEMHIAEHHPSFKAMRRKGQPSYERSFFYKKAIGIDDLPGSDNPYSIFAMNLFGLDEVEDYYWECLSLLERPVQQLVKDEKGDVRIRSILQVEANGQVFQHPTDNQLTTISKELCELVEHCCYAWDEWLKEVLAARDNKKGAMISNECLLKIVETCTYVSQQLELLARQCCSNHQKLSELRVNQRYALLASSLLQMYQERVEQHIRGYISEYATYCLNQYEPIKINTKRYVDLVLCYELAKCSERLEQEHRYAGKKISRDVELKSPNAFIYTRLHGGYKAEDIRVSYRWLFINAWLYSWLKRKDISASKAAQHIAQEDRFFYLNDDKEKLTDDGVKPSMEQLHARRAKSLNTEFSKWKNYKGPFGYISDTLFNKSSKGYTQEQDRKQ
ncbi:hypothetical protein [Vibrio sp. PID17_43]|uniref:hypothetical protein n=1 Tax=Vibrio sp. PID17_43 TaxID=1583451 RepID=UPI000BFFF8B7|nr:hypothetical protein [Vibrio sp. PID17_43]PHJ41261.1 hypothetical protein AK965_11840 [Vibrio sp. PID17_43]